MASALVVAVVLQLSGCMTGVQLLAGELPAAFGGTRLTAQGYSADARAGGPGVGRYVFTCLDLPASLLADFALLPLTIPCELAHEGKIDLIELKVSPW